MRKDIEDALTSSFVIVAQPRSGSTLLALALNSHPDLICHDEIFSQTSVHGYRGAEDCRTPEEQEELTLKLLDERNRDPEAFLFRRIFADSSNRKTGFKVVYGDLFSRSESSQFLLRFLIESRIKVIHLRRLNLLRCFISVERMSRLGFTHSSGKVPDDSEIELDLDEFLRFAVQQDGNSDLVSRSMNVVAHPRYEHLLQGYNVALDALRVPRRPFLQHLSKLSSHSLAGLVSNADAFAPYDFPRTTGFVAYTD